MRGNLPHWRTPFVGRRQEIEEVRSLLARAPVLTLTGPGGVGKTSLALAVAYDRRRAFPDGVWYVTLDGVADDRLVTTQVADIVGHRFEAMVADRASDLSRALRDRHLLLVLDNCEQVLDEVTRLVDRLARECAQVRILATSRTPLPALGLPAYEVPPLSMPAAEEASERSLEESDAMRFFIDRAERIAPGFAIRDGDHELVRGLLDDLDRLPLSIELAVSQLRSLTLRELAHSVAERHRLLRWTGREPDSRHGSLHSSLEWSEALCSRADRELWARLSVFRGTFDIDAVEAICDPDTLGDDVLDVLQRLVEGSLVARHDCGPTIRYSLLGIVRHFAAEMLTEPEASALRKRHTDWYIGITARAAADWNSARQAHWLRTLPDEHHNLVHALAAACDPEAASDLADPAARAVCDLWRYYWWAQGWLEEGRYWVERCQDRAVDPSAHARVLLLGSLLSFTAVGREEAAGMLAAGEVAARKSGDRVSLALAEHVHGDAAMYAGDLRAAVTHFRCALTLYPPESTPYRVDTMLMLLLACATAGDLDGARAAHADAVAALDPGERFQRSYALLYLGEGLRLSGARDEALAVVLEALALKEELSDPFGLAWTISILAELACDSGECEHAALLLGAAHRMWQSMAVDAPVLGRLQIHETNTEEQLRRVAGAGSYADLTRRGRNLDDAAVISLAMHRESAEPRTSAHPGALTPREWEVAGLVAQGMTNREIAACLVISQRTAAYHVQNMLTKLGFGSRTQIAAWYTQHPTAPDSPASTTGHRGLQLNAI